MSDGRTTLQYLQDAISKEMNLLKDTDFVGKFAINARLKILREQAATEIERIEGGAV